MIVLVGFMGAGKSSVGRALAEAVGLPFVDTDELIEARAAASIAEIFAASGESAFRDIEREVVAEVLGGEDAVVALGGGAVTDPATCAALEWAQVVHLDVPYAAAMRRIGADPGRPMLTRSDPKALYDERFPLYEAVADLTVPTSDRPAEEITAEIVRLLEGAARGPSEGAASRKVTVPLGERAYDVTIGAGIRSGIAGVVRDAIDAEVAVVVADETVKGFADEIAERLRDSIPSVRSTFVASGERSKSLEAAGSLYQALADAGVHRSDVVVAVGGGVVGDLAGFVASTFNRGVAIVHVPTTLLAQVDAAVGGKTGVNLPHGKNLVGTFHQPAAVVCDVETLATLPIEELRSGMAEVVKYGFISDPDLLDIVEGRMAAVEARDQELLVEIVSRSTRIKAGIVGRDEREAGARAHLNYGHTFAHAIERAAGFGEIRHGEAVALGMMAAAYLAHELGRIDAEVVDRHRRVLGAAGLPTRASLGRAELERAWAVDKKFDRGVRFVLLAGIGKPEAGIDAPRDAIDAALARMGST